VRRALLTAFFVLAACTKPEPDAVPGVRLGMTPHDVRERLVTGGEGTWQTRVGAAADDTALEWTAKDADKARVPHATFEFHLGMLVAVRAQVRERTSAPAEESVATTPRTVTLRRATPSGVTDVTVLARDCPTHHEEAESLASRAARSAR
jgi:hypothetical protein